VDHGQQGDGALQTGTHRRIELAECSNGRGSQSLLGLLRAYIDGSGPAGLVVATMMAAGLPFWLPAVYGSNPT